MLAALTGDEPLSQQELAGRLRIDRTTMVALTDGLEQKGLVRRQPHPGDRRKNIVVLTAAGRSTQRRAAPAIDEVERRFLAPLPAGEIQRLRDALRTLIE